MAKMSGAEFAEKWGRRLSTELETIRKGVESVTEAPTKKAAAKKDKWAAKMTAKETQDKWATNTGAVTLEEWKRQFLETGVSRIPGGVEANKDKVARFGEQLLSYIESNLPKVHAMPDVTYDQTKARMNAWFDAMSKFRPRK